MDRRLSIYVVAMLLHFLDLSSWYYYTEQLSMQETKNIRHNYCGIYAIINP